MRRANEALPKEERMFDSEEAWAHLERQVTDVSRARIGSSLDSSQKSTRQSETVAHGTSDIFPLCGIFKEPENKKRVSGAQHRNRDVQLLRRVQSSTDAEDVLWIQIRERCKRQYLFQFDLK